MAVQATTETPRLDRTLELLRWHRLSPEELRIMLAAHEREIAVSELAERFGRRAVDIRRIGARLYGRGLLRWRDSGEPDEALFGLTQAGTATVRPFLHEA